jgi:hypothetical protein
MADGFESSLSALPRFGADRRGAGHSGHAAATPDGTPDRAVAFALDLSTFAAFGRVTDCTRGSLHKVGRPPAKGLADLGHLVTGAFGNLSYRPIANLLHLGAQTAEGLIHIGGEILGELLGALPASQGVLGEPVRIPRSPTEAVDPARDAPNTQRLGEFVCKV